MELFVSNLAVISSHVKQLTMEIKVWDIHKHTLYTALTLLGQHTEMLKNMDLYRDVVSQFFW